MTVHTAFGRLSIGLFVAAGALGLGEVLTCAWSRHFQVNSFVAVIGGIALGLLAVVAGVAYAVLAGPEGRRWRPLGIGAALFAASVAAVPLASALSSATYVWAHRPQLDRVATLVASTDSAYASSVGIQCTGLAPATCADLSATLHALDSRGASIHDGTVRVWLRGDYSAARCPASCSRSLVPLGGRWHLIPQ